MDLLLLGLLNTLKITGTALAFGIPLGLFLALSRLAPTRWLSWSARFVIEFFRNTPVLVQILWFYYALPLLAPFEISPLMAA